MDEQTIERAVEEARRRYFTALADIGAALRRLCPEHNPTQKRDGKPPWCSRCGRGRLGEPIGKAEVD